jgi:glycosyltransferase involved in cell wall biosynthesis
MSEHERVAFVASYYPPHLGGMENVAESMAKAYSGHHACTVLTTTCGAGQAPRRQRQGNLEVRRYRGVEFAHTPFSIGLIARLLTLPRRTLVHVHVAQAVIPEFVWLSSVIRRRGFVAHFHLDVDASGPLGAVFLMYKRLVLRRVLQAAETVICLSTGQAEFLSESYGVDRTRIRVLPNGVTAEFFAEPKREISSSPLKLLYVGRLTAQKNVLRLIDAMAAVGSPAELVIVGDGQERGRVEEAVRRYDLSNVRLVGAQHDADLRQWYRWADAFVLPSDREGMPLVLLEAMAAALPIVSTDVMGSRELLGDTGLLVRADATDLAEAIDRLAADPTLRIELAERSSRRAQDYRWDHLAERLEEVYGAAAVL